MTDEQITVEDLDDLLRDVWAKSRSDDWKTVTIHPDGYHKPGEPDTDDSSLAVGDLVAWSVLRSSLLKGATVPDAGYPYLLGIVQNIEPWDDSLAGMVYVRFSNGAGAWKERDQLRAMPAGEALLDKPWLRKGIVDE